MFSKSKRIFVTGVAGFLGSHLSEKLVNLGHKVVGIDNMIGGVDGNVPALATYIRGDILETELMKEYL